ncbi:unnamed protein product [Boreogadus saida]
MSSFFFNQSQTTGLIPLVDAWSPQRLCPKPPSSTPCTPTTHTHGSNTVIKFADDTTVIVLFTGNETAYRRRSEVNRLAQYTLQQTI